MHVCFMQIKERVATSPSDLLFAMSSLCTVSVAKANHVPDGATTSRVQKEISFLWLTTGLSGKSIFYLSVGLYVWKNYTATS